LNDFNGCAADIGIIQGYYKTRYIPGSVKLLSDFEEGSSYNSQTQFYFCIVSCLHTFFAMEASFDYYEGTETRLCCC